MARLAPVATTSVLPCAKQSPDARLTIAWSSITSQSNKLLAIVF